MTIFWKIEYSYDLNETKLPGYQILDDNMVTIKITDIDGNELVGACDYAPTGEGVPSAPEWWVE